LRRVTPGGGGFFGGGGGGSEFEWASGYFGGGHGGGGSSFGPAGTTFEGVAGFGVGLALISYDPDTDACETTRATICNHPREGAGDCEWIDLAAPGAGSRRAGQERSSQRRRPHDEAIAD
jgi:hypothetical protein